MRGDAVPVSGKLPVSRAPAVLEQCRAGLGRLAEGPDVDAHAALVVRMTALREAVLRHLAHEETDTMALLQRVLSQEEWAAIDERFKRSFTPRQLAWAVPWMVDGLPDEVRSGMFAQRGARPLQVVHALFRRRFTALTARAFRHALPEARRGR